ncbi:MAG TPA: transglutaminase family protein [Acidimicrobiales bacterium]
MTILEVGDASRTARLDHRIIDWETVESATYVIRQTVRYEYPVPVTALRQRLMMIPPERHGDQKRVGWVIDASIPSSRRTSCDRFGNVCVDFRVGAPQRGIQFESQVVLERSPQQRIPASAPHRSLGRPTALTAADAELRQVAADLLAAGHRELALAEHICDWVSNRLRYQSGVTTVVTTAAEACRSGAGVCQDFAHVMLAVCRAAGIPARYVSGHLLGEGPSHAWVEVLFPNDGKRSWFAVAFDPTHGRPAGAAYLTIATGRDYRDVAPTSGTCVGPRPGTLHTTKDAFLSSVTRRP